MPFISQNDLGIQLRQIPIPIWPKRRRQANLAGHLRGVKLNKYAHAMKSTAKPTATRSETKFAIKGKVPSIIAVLAILVAMSVNVFGQGQTPLLQDIRVVKPTPSATPNGSLVRKTGDSSPMGPTGQPMPANNVRTMFPALAAVDIPGTSGVLIETMEGNVVIESNADALFNPASNVKIATTYAVLKSFGPDYRFATNIYTDGAVDRSTGTLNGNLYVAGQDPMFGYEHAVAIANE